MHAVKWTFASLFAVARNVALFVGAAALFSMGTPVPAYNILMAMVVLMAATLLPIHKAARAVAKDVAEGRRSSKTRDNLELLLPMLILHNIGTASMCAIVLVHRVADPFSHALAACCIAALMVSAAESLYCLLGKKGSLSNRRG